MFALIFNWLACFERVQRECEKEVNRKLRNIFLVELLILSFGVRTMIFKVLRKFVEFILKSYDGLIGEQIFERSLYARAWDRCDEDRGN